MKEQLKQRVREAIYAHKDEIYALADSIAKEPELGFKETKTARKIADFFARHNIPATEGHALTGVKGKIAGKSAKRTVAVLGELDAVVCYDHPMADPVTGAVHACGHNAQIAAMAACMAGLKESGVIDLLDGNVVGFAVPAEEYVEIEFRNKLREQGKLNYLGGKAQLVKEGAFDDIDMAMMIHVAMNGDNRRIVDLGGTANGFVGKMIKFIGKASHAAGAPEEGINALSAALVGLTAVNAQRETFKDTDCVRFHPIITRGGDLVNVVPSEVRMESYVRAKTVEAMMNANKKVNRALECGAMSIGAKSEIVDLPGQMPLFNDPAMTDLYAANTTALLGGEAITHYGHITGSTDMGDLAHIMPVIHPWVGGVDGVVHGRDFKVVDPEMVYLITGCTMAMTIVDLLFDGAAEAERLFASYQPKMTKQEYLNFMDSIK